ncbi:MAG: FAD-dependent oxidoreductase [Bacilli bacterium]|nr:FAD-dependent oxidoreductase [Bacilli bacterium]
MNTLTLKERNIPLYEDFDVIVVGGGPAGCTAAISAAREGAKTLLIEATTALGGMGTNGLVPSWCPFWDGEKIIYRGLAEEVFTRAKAGIKHVKQDALSWVEIDPEHLKRVYDDLMIEYGVTVLFSTMLCATEVNENGRVEAIIVSNKAGLTAYKAKVYVDCTGDADLVAFSGGEFVKGDDVTGEMQAVTHCFILSNVDTYGYVFGPWLNPKNPDSPVHKIEASGKYHLLDKHVCAKLIGPGSVGFNAGHMNEVDNTDPYSTSKAYMTGRKIAKQYRDALAEFHPEAFGNAFLVNTATLLGVRETRRIVGDYTLTLEDYAERRNFPDEICRNSYYLDIHNPTNLPEDELARRLERLEKVQQYKRGESHGIPYRCLVPRSLENVLVAGRTISVERVVQGSIRVMPVCLAMGEAAGMAAAHALNCDNNVHKVDIDRLRRRLKEENVYIL